MGIVNRIKSSLGSSPSPFKEDKSFMETATLEEKIKRSEEVIRAAYERFPHERIVLAWTGGKDSTFILWLVRRVCEKNG